MDRFALRPGTADDLPAINAVIERAIMSWRLPERVKRLSLPVYRYDAADLQSLEIMLAQDTEDNIVGIVAWDQRPLDVPGTEGRGLLLHGLYVDPQRHGLGIGTWLLHAAENAAQVRELKGVLVKAHSDAEGFFRRQGFEPVAILEPARDYAHRLWKPLGNR